MSQGCGDKKPVGFLKSQPELLSEYQQRQVEKLAEGVQKRNDDYLRQHPEIGALLAVFISKVVTQKPCSKILEIAATHFTRPYEILDREVRGYLNLEPEEPYQGYNSYVEPPPYSFDQIIQDVSSVKRPSVERAIKSESSASTFSTISSPFYTEASSETTHASLEDGQSMTESTLSHHFRTMLRNTADAVVINKIEPHIVQYDSIRKIVSLAVEQAMDVSVAPIRRDINRLLDESFKRCCLFLEYKKTTAEQAAAAAAGIENVGKSVKKARRMYGNFRGYDIREKLATDSMTEYPESLNEGRVRKLILRAPQYNRYNKDRFNVYNPIHEGDWVENATFTPLMPSKDNLLDNSGGNNRFSSMEKSADWVFG